MKGKLFLFFMLLLGLVANVAAEDQLTGKELTAANCTACHENKELNIASLEAMSLATENELFYVMAEGKMQNQTEHLSESEIRKIAKYISSAEETSLFRCSRALILTDLVPDEDWTKMPEHNQ